MKLFVWLQGRAGPNRVYYYPLSMSMIEKILPLPFIPLVPYTPLRNGTSEFVCSPLLRSVVENLAGKLSVRVGNICQTGKIELSPPSLRFIGTFAKVLFRLHSSQPFCNATVSLPMLQQWSRSSKIRYKIGYASGKIAYVAPFHPP